MEGGFSARMIQSGGGGGGGGEASTLKMCSGLLYNVSGLMLPSLLAG